MPSYFEFEIQLVEIEPLITRTLLLPVEATFADLHEAIQDAMGWQGHHLWEFRDNNEEELLAGCPDPDDPETPDAYTTPLSAYFPTQDVPEDGFWGLYIYDFGDFWLHAVGLSQIVTLPDTFPRRLLAGERACPPEDSGGPSGYDRIIHFLETQDADGEDPESLRAWIGAWRPEAFDLAKAAKQFEKPRTRKK